METSIHKAVETIETEGVLVYPTETVWGLGCSVFSEKAIDRIYQIKQRERNKPLIVLVENAEQLQYHTGILPQEILEIACGEEPTSIVYPQVLHLPPYILASDGSLAIRIAKHPYCLALIKAIKQALVSTSANIGGAPTPEFYAQISAEVLQLADYVVPQEIEEMYAFSGKSSRLFSLQNDNLGLSLLRV